jgi:hypothetical protein
MLLSILKSLSGCKTAKSLMILMVLSKLVKFPYVATLQLGEWLFSLVLLQILSFSSSAF